MENDLLNFIIEQRDLDEKIFKQLNAKITELKNNVSLVSNERFAVFNYFVNVAPDALQEYVEYVYKEFPNEARQIVKIFHDYYTDLSKFEVTGNDFEPWPTTTP